MLYFTEYCNTVVINGFTFRKIGEKPSLDLRPRIRTPGHYTLIISLSISISEALLRYSFTVRDTDTDRQEILIIPQN